MASFKRNAALTLAAYLAVVLLDKGAGFVVAYALRERPGDKGALDLLGNLGFLLVAFGNLGLATSLVYFLRRRLFGLKEVVETTVATGAVVGTVLAGLAAGATVAAARLWPGTVAVPPPELLLPAVAIVPFLLCCSYLNSAQVAVDRVAGYSLVNLVPSLLFLPLFLALFLGGHDAVRSSIWARAAVTVAAAGAAFLLVRRFLEFRPRWHGPFLRQALSYGWRANLMSLLTALGQRFHIYLVGLLAPGTDEERLVATGVFSLAFTLAEMVWYLPESMRDVFFSRAAGQTEEEARAFTPVVTRNLLALGVVGGLAAWFPLAWLAEWIFPRYSGLVLCLRILLPGTVAYVVAKILHFDLAGRGRINLGILCTATTVAVMVGLNLLLVPGHGAQGAAAASLGAYLAATALTLAVYGRVARVPIAAILIPRAEDLAHYRAAWTALRRRLRGGGGRP